MLSHEFMRNAYLAGTFVALACGVSGWFVVLRGQVFAGDALSHVAFVGAIAAAVAGLDARAGLFALTVVMAGGMAVLGRHAQPDDTVIGTVFAWVLGIGVLLLAVLATSPAGGSGLAAANTLFGSIFALSGGAARAAAVLGGAVALAVLVGARPLLLSTLDPELAAIRGIPVRAVGAAFLVLLALVTAESAQAVGTLLLLGLIAAPAGAAHRLTSRPLRGIVLSAAIAIGATWGGLALSYAIPSLPPSSAIIGLAAGAYAAASARDRLRAVSGARARGVRAGGQSRGRLAAPGATPPGPPPDHRSR